MRKFTIDNDASVEFDPFSFFMKDFQTGMPLLRCNSTGDLYPVTTRPPIGISPLSTFTVLSPELWHSRLGHPGAPVLSSFRKNNLIVCNEFQDNFVCHSCPLGKQVKLPFYDSFSYTSLVRPFPLPPANAVSHPHQLRSPGPSPSFWIASSVSTKHARTRKPNSSRFSNFIAQAKSPSVTTKSASSTASWNSIPRMSKPS